MRVLEAGELGEAGGADQVGILVGAEDGGAGQPAGIFFEGLVFFGFVEAAEGFGIEAEAFETEFAEGFGIGWGQLADLDGVRRHLLLIAHQLCLDNPF